MSLQLALGWNFRRGYGLLLVSKSGTTARAALLSEVEIQKEKERGQLEWDKIKTA